MPPTTRSKYKQTRLGRDDDDDDYTDDKADTTKDDPSRSRTSKAEPRDKEASRLKASGGGGASGDIKQPKKEPPVSSVTKRQRRQEQQQSRSGGRSPSPPPPAKRQKQQQQQHNKKQKKISSSGDITSPAEEASKDSKPILINRAPVLQLWAACVTQSLYPDTTWSTCLGIGSQISTLCAISKGRRIGTIEPGTAADSDGKARKAQAQAQESAAGGKELEVMGFTLHVNRDGEVMVQGKPKKKANEGLLRGKFAHGEEDEEDEERQDGYERVKSAMNDALGSWKGTGKEKENKEELNRRAFAMYERFRPSVQSGQRGWGRKGVLKVEEIREAVRYGA